MPAVDAQLIDWQAGHRLNAGQEDPAFFEPEPVSQLVAGEHLGERVRLVIHPRDDLHVLAT